MVDPGGIANWSVTYADWSEGKWLPRAFKAPNVNSNLLNGISVCNKPCWFCILLLLKSSKELSSSLSLFWFCVSFYYEKGEQEK